MRARVIFTVTTVTFRSVKGTQKRNHSTSDEEEHWLIISERCLAVLMLTQHRDFSAFQQYTGRVEMKPTKE